MFLCCVFGLTSCSNCTENTIQNELFEHVDTLHKKRVKTPIFASNYLGERKAIYTLQVELDRDFTLNRLERVILSKLITTFKKDSAQAYTTKNGTILSDKNISEGQQTGVFGFSQPVYSDNDSIACVYAAIECAKTKCGGDGGVFYFRKDKCGNYRFYKYRVLWVSEK